MTKDQAKQAIRERYAEFLTKARDSGYICPQCGNGSGSDGTGAKINPKDPDKTHLKCHRCGFYGDTFEILKAQRGLEFPEAFATACEELGITIDGKDDPGIIVHTVKPQEPKPEKDYSNYLEQMKANVDAAEGYLSSRGISMDTARRFGLGLDMRFRASEDRGIWRALIIPTGKNSFVVRNTDPAAEKKKRYDRRGKLHFLGIEALYNAQKRPVFVTEGEIDAISVYEAGGLACGLGSAENADKFIAYVEAHPTDNIFLLALDNDKAGQESTECLEKGLKRLGMTFRTVQIFGDSKDANEAWTKDPDGLRAAILAEEAKCKPGAGMVFKFLDNVKGKRYEPVRTGFEPLDDVLRGGFLRQTLVTLGAAPGMGKTFFAQQLLEGMAQNGHNVLYFNLEMSREQMLARSFARIARERENATMEALDILQGYRWTQKQRELIEGKIAPYYIETIAPHISYNPGGSTADLDTILSQMNAAAERATEAGIEAPIVCIDYLHLLRGTAREDVQTVIKRAVDAFKGYAMQKNTIVLCIIAFNRSSNSDGKVRMESGRDTSAIEYSGDLMLGLNYSNVEDNTDKKADPEDLRDKAIKELQESGETCYKLKILKDRLQGYTGSEDMIFHGKYGLFYPKIDKASKMPRSDQDLPDFGGYTVGRKK